jgi:3,4-dihydroxy 2-butanone 4-phosphate synthase/GTP cyclohydrolase II
MTSRSARAAQAAAPQAFAALAAGQPIVVVDERADTAVVTFAACRATAELVAFMVRYTSGFLTVAIGPDTTARLRLPVMAGADLDRPGPDYRVTVDAADDIETGISARDRARTIRLLGEPATLPQELSRPGHVVPVRVRANGVLDQLSIPEAVFDAVRLSGLPAAGAYAHIVSPRNPTRLARADEAAAFAERFTLGLTGLAEIRELRLAVRSSIPVA